jgi:hypothetical protein
MEDGLVGETLLDLDVENEIHMDRLRVALSAERAAAQAIRWQPLTCIDTDDNLNASLSRWARMKSPHRGGRADLQSCTFPHKKLFPPFPPYHFNCMLTHS